MLIIDTELFKALIESYLPQPRVNIAVGTHYDEVLGHVYDVSVPGYDAHMSIESNLNERDRLYYASHIAASIERGLRLRSL